LSSRAHNGYGQAQVVMPHHRQIPVAMVTGIPQVQGTVLAQPPPRPGQRSMHAVSALMVRQAYPPVSPRSSLQSMGGSLSFSVSVPNVVPSPPPTPGAAHRPLAAAHSVSFSPQSSPRNSLDRYLGTQVQHSFSGARDQMHITPPQVTLSSKTSPRHSFSSTPMTERRDSLSLQHTPMTNHRNALPLASHWDGAGHIELAIGAAMTKVVPPSPLYSPQQSTRSSTQNPMVSQPASPVFQSRTGSPIGHRSPIQTGRVTRTVSAAKLATGQKPSSLTVPSLTHNVVHGGPATLRQHDSLAGSIRSPAGQHDSLHGSFRFMGGSQVSSRQGSLTDLHSFPEVPYLDNAIDSARTSSPPHFAAAALDSLGLDDHADIGGVEECGSWDGSRQPETHMDIVDAANLRIFQEAEQGATGEQVVVQSQYISMSAEEEMRRLVYSVGHEMGRGDDALALITEMLQDHGFTSVESLQDLTQQVAVQKLQMPLRFLECLRKKLPPSQCHKIDAFGEEADNGCTTDFVGSNEKLATKSGRLSPVISGGTPASEQDWERSNGCNGGSATKSLLLGRPLSPIASFSPCEHELDSPSRLSEGRLSSTTINGTNGAISTCVPPSPMAKVREARNSSPRAERPSIQSANSSVQRHLERQQRARKEKLREMHGIRISAHRWEHWDDPGMEQNQRSVQTSSKTERKPASPIGSPTQGERRLKATSPSRLVSCESNKATVGTPRSPKQQAARNVMIGTATRGKVGPGHFLSKARAAGAQARQSPADMAMEIGMGSEFADIMSYQSKPIRDPIEEHIAEHIGDCGNYYREDKLLRSMSELVETDGVNE